MLAFNGFETVLGVIAVLDMFFSLKVGSVGINRR